MLVSFGLVHRPLGHGQSKAYLADAIAALIGSMLGVSTVATFAESTAGVADGAKTGGVGTERFWKLEKTPESYVKAEISFNLEKLHL